MTKIIADFCANHLADTRLIDHGIKLLADAGVDMVKFQAFKADKLNPKFPNYKENLEYYKSVELKEIDYWFILKRCSVHGISPLFTVFDLEAVDFIKNFGLKHVKIASPDGDNLELIKKCIDNFKTVYISDGMMSRDSRAWLYNAITKKEFPGCDIKVLYCISKYPTNINDINFKTMSSFAGFSDHTIGTEAAKKAIDMGLEVVEKHFTLGRDLPGRDQAISGTIDEFKELVEHRNYIEKVKHYKVRWQS